MGLFQFMLGLLFLFINPSMKTTVDTDTTFSVVFIEKAKTAEPTIKEQWDIINEKTKASWYGPGFHGRTTANGEKYNMYDMTAAHKTLPFGTMVKVTNLTNEKTIIVRINDRGPYSKGRSIDLSKVAMQELDGIHSGVISVKLEILID